MTNPVIAQVVQVMDRQYALDLSVYDERFLLKVIHSRCGQCRVSPDDYAAYLGTQSTEAARFIADLRVTYTEFFRNPLAFAHLEHWILPRLIKGKSAGHELRVWSAGCSTGQEAYSVAMLLAAQRRLQDEVLFRVIGTDIDEANLRVAESGEYREDDLDNVPMKYVKAYFTARGGRHQINAELRRHVSFARYDLLDRQTLNPPESIFADYDLIFCSNLLYYYRSEQHQFMIQKVMRALAPHGYLITGSTERFIFSGVTGLRMIVPPATIYQKEGVDVLHADP
jgi:chemotaxis methyl-accepting protein methylase